MAQKYFFIAILCVKMSRVNKALIRDTNIIFHCCVFWTKLFNQSVCFAVSSHQSIDLPFVEKSKYFSFSQTLFSRFWVSRGDLFEMQISKYERILNSLKNSQAVLLQSISWICASRISLCLRLEPIFNTTPAASKNDAWFKKGSKSTRK